MSDDIERLKDKHLKVERRQKIRMWIVGIVSFLWVVLGVVLVMLKCRGLTFTQISALLQLNELGDFLAGWLAPLAFVWLILGFFQQSEEMRLNSDALLIDAEELNQSNKYRVKDLELQSKKNEEEEKRRIPRFAVKKVRDSADQKAGELVWNVYFGYFGGTITDIRFTGSTFKSIRSFVGEKWKDATFLIYDTQCVLNLWDRTTEIPLQMQYTDEFKRVFLIDVEFNERDLVLSEPKLIEC